MAKTKKKEAEIKDVEIKVEDNVKAPVLRNDPDPRTACTATINFGVYVVNLRIDNSEGYGLITMPDGSQFEFTGEIQSV